MFNFAAIARLFGFGRRSARYAGTDGVIPVFAAWPGAQDGDKTSSRGPGRRMVVKLAFRNLIHDRLSLVVTLIGIVFSVVLLSFQSGLYFGIEQTIARVIDAAPGEIVIAPVGTKSFDDPSLLEGREQFAAIGVEGVARSHQLAVGFARFRTAGGGKSTVLLVGSDWRRGGLRPWNLIEGHVDALNAPGGVAIDESALADLNVSGLNAEGEINGQRVVVKAISRDIRSFTTMPYVFTTLEQGRKLIGARREQASYVFVSLEDGADADEVRRALQSRLPDTEVLTKAQFRQRSVTYWLFSTAAGAGLIAGTLLALIVGIVIVAQTLYASTKDHLAEFATLRALGATSRYIVEVILLQALMAGAAGFAAGIGLTGWIVALTAGSSLDVVMTPWLAVLLALATLSMCSLAALAAILKVLRIDPAGVFSR